MSRIVTRALEWLRHRLGFYSPSLLVMGDRAEHAWWREYVAKHPDAYMDPITRLVVFGPPDQDEES